MDFTPVVREWCKEVPNELDFLKERENMLRVASNLAPFRQTADDSLRINVSLASVVPDLCTAKVLVMSKIDGFKVNDLDALQSLKVDRTRLMNDISKAWAQQIFCDGFYSGDPHPGNILVDRSTLEPVLLDFGLTKELSPATKLAFSKLIVAADEADIYGLLLALEDVGLKLRTDVPFDLNLLAKYFFREAKPAAEAQEENSKRRAEWKSKAEEKTRNIYVGDKVDVVEKNLVGWRTETKGEVVGFTCVGESLTVQVRSTDGSLLTAKRSDCKLQKTRSPIDGWPDAFIFFERVLGLLRGLTASLDVRQSYMDVMTPFARKNLAQHPLAANAAAFDRVVGGSDSLGVTAILKEALVAGNLLGAQVVVQLNDEIIVDLVAGASSPYFREPVEHDTLFCSFSTTKGVSASTIHELIDNGKIKLTDPVAYHWKEFAAGGKEAITVADLLNHKAGLQDAGTEDLIIDPLLSADSDFMINLMANAIPDPESLGKTRYHYLSMGWLLDGLFRSVEGRPLAEHVQQEYGLSIGVPASTPAPRIADLVLKKFDPNTSSQTRSSSSSSSSASGQARRRPAEGSSLLMNPTYFNSPKIRAASLPAANGFFSARQLAAFYSSRAGKLASALKQAGTTEQTLVTDEALLQGGSGSIRLGLRR